MSERSSSETRGEARTKRPGSSDHGAGVPTGCRGPRDADGQVSFDAVVLGLYGSPRPALLVSLPAIANDAAHLFDQIALTSTLEVAPESALGRYSITHTLMSAAFYNTPFQMVRPDDMPKVPTKAARAWSASPAIRSRSRQLTGAG